MKTITEPNSGKTCPPPYIPNSEKMSADKIQNTYDEMANKYEKRIWFDQNILGVKRNRKKLLSKASGTILDVACGTGQNFAWFKPNSEITAVDLSTKMIDVAKENANKLNLNINFAVMDAEHLEFADESFDTVVSALSTCTFPNPIKALQEMKRVCRKGGLILLLEHGHSSMKWLANHQDRNVLPHYQAHAGCRWNQEPLDLVKEAGLDIKNSKRFGLGIFHVIEAN
jgi:ubiquinone/menaquinone biosynthesis C-methylase UbiE